MTEVFFFSSASLDREEAMASASFRVSSKILETDSEETLETLFKPSKTDFLRESSRKRRKRKATKLEITMMRNARRREVLVRSDIGILSLLKNKT